MVITNYIILTALFEQYGRYRFLEGMYKESRMFNQQMEYKSLAADVWERAFNIVKEMENNLMRTQRRILETSTTL